MVRVQDGREGLLYGAVIGAITYLWLWMSKSQDLASVMSAAAQPSWLEKTLGFILVPTFKTFLMYVLIGAVIGFFVDIAWTYITERR